jgi:CheY-like chemotaxis protein
MGRIVPETMKNIYFADDDPDDREIFAELFYEMFPVEGLRLFESGKALTDALSAPAGPLPDLILLDLQMPLKDGFECLKEIRGGREDIFLCRQARLVQGFEIPDTQDSGNGLGRSPGGPRSAFALMRPELIRAAV